jgi:hypothetical protein
MGEFYIFLEANMKGMRHYPLERSLKKESSPLKQP